MSSAQRNANVFPLKRRTQLLQGFPPSQIGWGLWLCWVPGTLNNPRLHMGFPPLRPASMVITQGSPCCRFSNLFQGAFLLNVDNELADCPSGVELEVLESEPGPIWLDCWYGWGEKTWCRHNLSDGTGSCQNQGSCLGNDASLLPFGKKKRFEVWNLKQDHQTDLCQIWFLEAYKPPWGGKRFWDELEVSWHLCDWVSQVIYI